MIIGKNTNFQAKQNNFMKPKSTNKPMQAKTGFNQTMQHTDVMNKNDMYDKSFNMLQDRLNKGLISLEEFNKKCAQLGKRK